MALRPPPRIPLLLFLTLFRLFLLAAFLGPLLLLFFLAGVALHHGVVRLASAALASNDDGTQQLRLRVLVLLFFGLGGGLFTGGFACGLLGLESPLLTRLLLHTQQHKIEGQNQPRHQLRIHTFPSLASALSKKLVPRLTLSV